MTKELAAQLKRQPTAEEVISYVLYPDVYLDYVKRNRQYGKIGVLDTNTFYQGMRPGEKIYVNLRPGRTEILESIRFLTWTLTATATCCSPKTVSSLS